MYIKFLDMPMALECTLTQVKPNVVELQFPYEIVVNTSGFKAYLDAQCKLDIGGNSYVDYNTIYRNDEYTKSKNCYLLSNDGSVYEEQAPVVSFKTSDGGILEGNTKQQVRNYEDLIIPDVIPNENYMFSNWSPEIPLSGNVDRNYTFTAIFKSTIEPEEPSAPTSSIMDDILALKESVFTLENDVKAINSALGGTVDE